ncbi:hypothetical protein CDD80_6366 [Ophiocordyceps camponoti-rufipedis]|uniref:Uncharacterized protein n=1 Tax=Ophiocordyceps camponoti-rufipedis TaxID=2004952 RepID=A0A2C5ZHQ3_9HYPO|nr:hypothetical protein CDD80_6366 [Ophiocordyceps camponoti-rufipedis]
MSRRSLCKHSAIFKVFWRRQGARPRTRRSGTVHGRRDPIVFMFQQRFFPSSDDSTRQSLDRHIENARIEFQINMLHSTKSCVLSPVLLIQTRKRSIRNGFLDSDTDSRHTNSRRTRLTGAIFNLPPTERTSPGTHLAVPRSLHRHNFQVAWLKSRDAQSMISRFRSKKDGNRDLHLRVAQEKRPPPRMKKRSSYGCASPARSAKFYNPDEVISLDTVWLFPVPFADEAQHPIYLVSPPVILRGELTVLQIFQETFPRNPRSPGRHRLASTCLTCGTVTSLVLSTSLSIPNASEDEEEATELSMANPSRHLQLPPGRGRKTSHRLALTRLDLVEPLISLASLSIPSTSGEKEEADEFWPHYIVRAIYILLPSEVISLGIVWLLSRLRHKPLNPLPRSQWPALESSLEIVLPSRTSRHTGSVACGSDAFEDSLVRKSSFCQTTRCLWTLQLCFPVLFKEAFGDDGSHPVETRSLLLKVQCRLDFVGEGVTDVSPGGGRSADAAAGRVEALAREAKARMSSGVPDARANGVVAGFGEDESTGRFGEVGFDHPSDILEQLRCGSSKLNREPEIEFLPDIVDSSEIEFLPDIVDSSSLTVDDDDIDGIRVWEAAEDQLQPWWRYDLESWDSIVHRIF